jgi:Domain of unknown function (DUF4157)
MKTRIARDVATARRSGRPISAAMGTAGVAQAEADRARIRTVLRAPSDWRAPATTSVPASTTEHGATGAPSNTLHAAMRKLGRLRERDERAGEPLPYLHQMESAFGRPFGDVEAYTGMAAELRPFGAEALTAGNVVAFADAAPSPALVAHEATHVIQNRIAGASAVMAPDVAARDSPPEVEAARIASLVAAHGSSVALPPVTARPSGGVQLAPSPPTPANLENMTILDVGDGDRFQVKMIQSNDEKNHISRLTIDIDYAGKDDQDGHRAEYAIFAVRGRRPAAMLKQDTSDGWKSLEIDLYGDGTHVTKITHTVMLLPGWSPKSRKHTFRVVGPYSFHQDDEIVIKSKNALPAAIAEAKPEGLPASSPVKVSDTAPETLSSDTAVIAAKRLLDELVEHTPHSALGQLQRRITAEHAKLAGKPDDPAAATRLSRLVDAIHAVRPMMQALQLASLRESYLPDIAGDAIRMVSDVKQLYGAALEEAYDSGAGKKMLEADQAFNAIWYRLSWLYLQSSRGIGQLVQAASFAIKGVRTARDHAGRGAYHWRALESQLGVQGTGEVGEPKVREANEKARQVREEYLMGQVGSLSRISKVVDDAHVIMGLSGLLAVNESFYAMKKDMDGIVGGAFDYLGRDLSKVCSGYTARFAAILDDTEKGIRARGDFWQLGSAATTRFHAIITSPTFKLDLDAISSRIKWIKAIEIIGKVLAIVGVAAFTGGAAGAAVGGALEGAGASAGVIAAGEFAAEVATFTLVSRLGNQLAFGRSDTSLGEDLVTNTLMFGFLKAAAAAYGRVFKLIADPKIYKATHAVGRAVTGMLALQAFAEVHYRVKEGKWMSGSDRALAVFQNATMLVALGLGSYLTRPLATRLNNKILVVTAKYFPGRLEKIGAKLTDVRASLDGLAKGDPATADKVPNLLKKIEQVWNEEISVIAEAAKRERTADAQKAFSDAVDGYVKEIARIDLQLARAGLDVDLGVAGAGKLFRPFRPGFVAFKPEGKGMLEAYYKESKGTFEKIKDDLYSGKVNGEETFFVPEDTLKKPSLKTAGTKPAKGEQVDKPKEGVFTGVVPAQPGKFATIESADPAKNLEHRFRLLDGPVEADPEHPGFYRIITWIGVDSTNLHDGTTQTLGEPTRSSEFWIERSYNPKTGELLMKNAFIKGLPSKIDAGGTALTAEGTPLVTYLSIRQMKALGVPFRSSKTAIVRMTNIYNIEAVLELRGKMKPIGDPKTIDPAALLKDANAAIAQTGGYKYALTTLTQSGLRVKSVRIGGDVKPKPIDEMLKYYETHKDTSRKRDPKIVEQHDALLKKHGITRQTLMLWNYDVVLDVEPWTP